MLSHKSEVKADNDGSAGSAKSRKAKKRARGYEGDEVFKMTRSVICPAQEDGEVILATLDGEHLIYSLCTESLNIVAFSTSSTAENWTSVPTSTFIVCTNIPLSVSVSSPHPSFATVAGSRSARYGAA